MTEFDIATYDYRDRSKRLLVTTPNGTRGWIMAFDPERGVVSACFDNGNRIKLPYELVPQSGTTRTLN